MKPFFSSAFAIATLAILSGCGSPTNAATPLSSGTWVPRAVRPHLATYNFVFSNKTSATVEVTRSHEECMTTPPPSKFSISANSTVRYKLETACAIDPSTFRLSFVSGSAGVDVKYVKHTGNEWAVSWSNASGLKFVWEIKVIVIGGTAFTHYENIISP